jgi:hypothetical protein
LTIAQVLPTPKEKAEDAATAAEAAPADETPAVETPAEEPVAAAVATEESGDGE